MAASSRSLLDFGKWCLEMPKSLGHWCPSALVNLRTGNSYVPWGSSILCFTEEASGSLKMHNFWDLKCWFEGIMCVYVCKTQMGWPEASMIHTCSALALDWGGQVLQALENLTLKYSSVWLWWCLVFTLCKAPLLTDTDFSWIWETAEFLKLGRKQKKKTVKREKTMVKKWKSKASRNKERI